MSKLQIESVDEQAERRRRFVKVGVLATVSCAVVAGGAYLAWLLTPPGLPGTLDDALALAHSPRFQRLSDRQKQPYLDRIREQFGSLSREQRRAMLDDDAERDLAREAWRSMMRQRMKEFGAATPAERLAMMEGMQRRRPRGEGRPQEGRGEGQRQGERRGRDPGAMRNRMSDRMANGNAQMMGYMGEFIRARRKQRQQAR